MFQGCILVLEGMRGLKAWWGEEVIVFPQVSTGPGDLVFVKWPTKTGTNGTSPLTTWMPPSGCSMVLYTGIGDARSFVTLLQAKAGSVWGCESLCVDSLHGPVVPAVFLRSHQAQHCILAMAQGLTGSRVREAGTELRDHFSAICLCLPPLPSPPQGVRESLGFPLSWGVRGNGCSHIFSVCLCIPLRTWHSGKRVSITDAPSLLYSSTTENKIKQNPPRMERFSLAYWAAPQVRSITTSVNLQ